MSSDEEWRPVVGYDGYGGERMDERDRLQEIRARIVHKHAWTDDGGQGCGIAECRANLYDVEEQFRNDILYLLDVIDSLRGVAVNMTISRPDVLDTPVTIDPPAPRWIPVSERLPHSEQWYVALVVIHEVDFNTRLPRTLIRIKAHYPGQPRAEDSTHWMPLPEPPK